jgi:hypothetical protein
MKKGEPSAVTDIHACDGALSSIECVQRAYQGTAADRREMRMLGKQQVLRRQFKFVTMLGFASTVSKCKKQHVTAASKYTMLICYLLSKVVAWEFVLLVSPFDLVDGGTPAVFWGLLLSPIVMLPVYASLAEVASMSPTAGGQFHWVSELAPPRFQKGLSYTTGWLLTLGWQTFLCGVSFSVVSRTGILSRVKY